MGFCHRLKELRIEKNLTQKELASYLSLSPNSICEWEKGRCEPGIEQLKKLSALFECSIDFLTENADDFGNVVINGESSALTSKEKKLLEDFRALSPDLQEMIELTIQTWKKKAGNSFTNNRRA